MTDLYLESYENIVLNRFDALPRKRKAKIQCKPGFVQRGAACQKMTPGVAKEGGGKPSGGGAMKKILAGAAVAGISAAAVATAMKKNPNLVNDVNAKTKELVKALDKPAPKKLSESAQKVVDKATAEIDKKIGKQPSKGQQIGKQIGIELASKIVAVNVGDLTGMVVGAKSGSGTAGVIGGLAAGRATRVVARKGLNKAFGGGNVSKETQRNITIGMDIAHIAAKVALEGAIASRL